MGRRGMLIGLAALLLPASAAGLTTNQTVLVDRPSGDAPLPYDGAGRGFVAPKAISADGCYVVFAADSDPLFAGDDNGARNLYRYSRCGGPSLALVNTSDSGVPAEFGSQNTTASISADGNRVAFSSTSATLEPASNGSTQVYVKDLTSSALQIVSRGDGPTGSITQEANSGMISADGQHVAFIARGVLDTDNVNGVAGTYDVYERSIPDATTHMVSVTYPGELEGGGIASFVQPGISHDGRIVSFNSGSKLTADDTDAGGDAYVRQGLNGGTEVTRLVSFSTGQTAGADGVFGAVDVSDDGSKIAWSHGNALVATCAPACSAASIRDVAEPGGSNPTPNSFSVTFPRTTGISTPDNLLFISKAPLVPGDTNGANDLYTRTFSAPTTILLTDGTSSEGILAGTMTDDGSLVAFGSFSPEFPASGGFLPQAYLRLRPSGATTLISAPDRVEDAGDADVTRRPVSADGRYVVFESDATGFGATVGQFGVLRGQVLLRDVVSGTTTLLSATPDGTPGDRTSGQAEIDSAGDKVVFRSAAGNLPGAGGDHTGHVYVRDIASGTVRMLDVTTGGVPSDTGAFDVAISGDGTTAVFGSAATNLPDAPGDGQSHAYLVDLGSGAMTLVDRASDGTISNQSVGDFDLDADGSRVAFQTGATNLGVATGGNEHVYVRDVPSATLTWVSVPESGNPADGFAHWGFLTADGHKIAFTNNTATFGHGQTDGTTHAFLRDLDTGAVTDLGAGIPGPYSGAPTLSADGSKASVVAGPNNVQTATYVRDLATGAVSPGSTRDGTTELARGQSATAALSGSGACLAFTAQSDDVVAGGYGPDLRHVYLRALDATCLPNPPGPGGGADTTAPVVSSFSVTNKRFALAARKTAAVAKKRRVKRGTTFRFRMSENAAVRIVIARKLAGRRKGKRCVAPTRKLRRAKRCARYKSRHTLRRAKGVAGLNRVAYSGRVGKTKLRPGTYRATLTATDAAGNRSRARRVSFRVVKRSHGA